MSSSFNNTSTKSIKTENFLLDIPYSELDEDSFRQDLLLAERPAILRAAAVATIIKNNDDSGKRQQQDNAFLRCLPLFSSFEAMETVALGPNFDLAAAGVPEVSSNAFMSCDRRLYRDIPVNTVKEALRVVKRSNNHNSNSNHQCTTSASSSSAHEELP